MISLNQQAIEKEDWQINGCLDVVEIWPTIQGEGPFAGVPAVFVRLAGCNLQCPTCDTDYTSKRRSMTRGEIFKEVERHIIGPSPLVVLTGGEPFRQNISPLCWDLVETGHRVQVETNGTLWQNNMPGDGLTIVCSPKTPKINDKLTKRIDAYKYIIEAGHVDPDDGLPTLTMKLARPARPCRGRQSEILVQPLDVQDPEQNKQNVDAAVASCLKFGYRLSLQLHKIVGVS